MRTLRAAAVLAAACALAACAHAPDAPLPPPPAPEASQPTRLPHTVPQGALVIGRVDPRALVEVSGRRIRVAPTGQVVFGIARDATGAVVVEVRPPGEATRAHLVHVTPRDWPEERVDGVPPATVSPPPEIAERIAREQASVSSQRTRDDARTDFAAPLVWPVEGRISGRFGNRRVYNGTPGAPHSGMDIAAPNGTPVRAPAAGIVTFAAPDLYLTGGTVLIDHGAGVSSNFLHLSRIDVRVGDRVEQGQVFGAVGATGRATGPHLHWGMNWFDTRIDPLLVLEGVGRASDDDASATTP